MAAGRIRIIRRCCWVCCSTVTRRGSFRAASWSGRPTIRWRSATSRRTRIRTTTRLRVSASVFSRELQGLFVQILLIAQEAGLLKLGNVSLDGTKGSGEREQAQGAQLGICEAP